MLISFGSALQKVRVVETHGPVGHQMPFRVDTTEITSYKGTAVVIRVYVIRGIKLAATDAGNTSDPYVICSLGEQSHKTAVCQKTLDPYFGNMFEFKVRGPMFVYVAVVDHHQW